MLDQIHLRNFAGVFFYTEFTKLIQRIDIQFI